MKPWAFLFLLLGAAPPVAGQPPEPIDYETARDEPSRARSARLLVYDDHAIYFGALAKDDQSSLLTVPAHVTLVPRTGCHLVSVPANGAPW